MTVTIDGTSGINTPGVVNTAAETIATTLAVTGVTTVQAGTAALPAITTTGDTNTGIFFPAADTIAFAEGGAEAVRINSLGNVGIGTSSPGARLDITEAVTSTIGSSLGLNIQNNDSRNTGELFQIGMGNASGNKPMTVIGTVVNTSSFFGNGDIFFATRSVTTDTAPTERARIDSSGSLLVGKTASSFGTAGIEISVGGNKYSTFTRSGGGLADFNRLSDDGELVGFYQDSTKEGSISVSGTTVSYNGGHLSRWAQTTAPKDDTLVKGTVLSNLDEMNVYTKDGQPVDNEQLNKVKVSDVEGDANVAGVFVNWSHDDDHDVDEINMAMTGDMIIRIAQGVTVARGDLLMSAGDGTAKPQGDDIVRSKTVAKVTSTHVSCTYADGSFCVPCVLMAC
jgi:hypothetical protein